MIENWTEKYRPKTLNDVIGQDSIIKKLQDRVNNGKNISNLIFHGRAGTGKTTTVKALAYDLFGEKWKMAFYETNASDDRGLEAIRNKIIPATKHLPLIPVPFKIIFLDESDGITPDAQACLRVPMEKTPNVRFILSCNHLSKIIEEIVSRCTVYEFKPIDKADIVKRLQYIANRECLAIDVQQLEILAELCKGDLRKAINNLQMGNIPGKTDKQTFSINV